MTDRKFQPGARKGVRRNSGQITDNRIAWLRTIVGQSVLMKYEFGERPEDDSKVAEEVGPTYLLVISVPGGRPAKINLSALTEEELNKTREFFNLAFDLAMPVVRQRDEVARDAEAAGDDSFVRNYRQVSQLVRRKGALREDQEGVLDRPSDLPQGSGGGVGRPGGAGGVVDELDSAQPPDSSGEHDGSENVQP